LPFAGRAVALQRCFATTNNLAATYTRCDAEIHIILSFCILTALRTGRSGFRIPAGIKTVFCSSSTVKRSEGLSNLVFIITGRHTDEMKFAAYMAL